MSTTMSTFVDGFVNLCRPLCQFVSFLCQLVSTTALRDLSLFIPGGGEGGRGGRRMIYPLSTIYTLSTAVLAKEKCFPEVAG